MTVSNITSNKDNEVDEKDGSWSLLKVFSGLTKAKINMKQERSFSLHYVSETEDGLKMYYRCNKVSIHRSKQCPVQLYLSLHKTTDKVFMFRTNAAHYHERVKK